MKILRVGDPHVQVSNLKDSEALLDFVISTAIKEKVTAIEFLGDLFHTHAILRVEVVDFWKRAFEKIKFAHNDYQGIECRVLVGNHDQPGSREKEQVMNALNMFQDKDHTPDNGGYRYIINRPMIIDGIGYVPYHSNQEHFISEAALLYNQGAMLLVAHQTFTGAQYENGFFSEEGIDPEKLLQKQIISGHIHKSQQVGKCFYPGTPKWDTMADANQEKGIWIFTHDKVTGMYTDKEFISTEHIVTPIKTYEVKEGDELPELNPEARNYVILEGKSAWISKIKKDLSKLANIKVKPTDRITKVNKNNSITLEKYLETEFQPIEGVDKQDIKQFVSNI